jgi:hypothetical protein
MQQWLHEEGYHASLDDIERAWQKHSADLNCMWVTTGKNQTMRVLLNLMTQID